MHADRMLNINLQKFGEAKAILLFSCRIFRRNTVWGNYGITYDEIIWCNLWGNYASLEPFWDLKISKDVELVSYVCIQWIHYKLSATFSDKYRWCNSCVLLAYVMPWINIASLALHIIAHIIVKGLAGPQDCSVPCRNQPEGQKMYCAVEFVSVIEALTLVAINVETQERGVWSKGSH